jgi:large subunit ribosomal protein L25
MSEGIFTLDAEIRTDLGKGASRRLRRAEKVPAILYGGGKDPVSLTLEHNKVIQAQEFEAFYSHVLTLTIGGKKESVLVKDIQRHPFKPKVTHLDFLRIEKNKPVHTSVPIHFVNEDSAPAIKTQGGHAEHHLNSLNITCLPKDLPEFIEVDLAPVELGQTLHLSDIKLPKGVTLDELSKGEDHDQAVVTVKAAKGGGSDSSAETEQEDTEE